ncbi:MAG: sortase [Rubrobacteraceae bacterium]
MRVKKFILILAALATVFALAACISSGSSSNQGSKKKDQSAQGKAGKKSKKSGPTTMSKKAKSEPVAPKKGAGKTGKTQANIAPVPKDKTFKLTVPEMSRVKSADIPTALGSDSAQLKAYAGIHLQGTGFPWEKGSNTYVAGHRLGYPNTGSYLAFYDLNAVKQGDKLYVTDANGHKYTYKVFREFVVAPTDVYVTEPVKGKTVLTLQSCTLPDYTKRLIIQAELVKS